MCIEVAKVADISKFNWIGVDILQPVFAEADKVDLFCVSKSITVGLYKVENFSLLLFFQT